jgi:hypothetical protein
MGIFRTFRRRIRCLARTGGIHEVDLRTGACRICRHELASPSGQPPHDQQRPAGRLPRVAIPIRSLPSWLVAGAKRWVRTALRHSHRDETDVALSADAHT